MRKKVKLIQQLQAHFGAGWLVYRVGYAARLRSGLMRQQLPVVDWDKRMFNALLKGPRLTDPVEYLRYRRTKAPSFFFSNADMESFRPKLLQHDTPTTNPIQTADALLNGTLTYFSQTPVYIGSPPSCTTIPSPNKRCQSTHTGVSLVTLALATSNKSGSPVALAGSTHYYALIGVPAMSSMPNYFGRGQKIG